MIKIDQTNRDILCINNPAIRILKIVTIIFIAPDIEDIPDTCKLKIAKSTEGPGCDTVLNGGYTVQPVPTPPSIKADKINKNKDGGNSQKLKLFNLGNAISAAPTITGTKILPKPPINTGITIKKIIKNACEVTITL